MAPSIGKLLTGVLLLSVVSVAVADQAASYQDATTFSQGQLSANPASNSANTVNVPNYTTAPPQASYYGNSGAMAVDGNAVAQTSQAGQFLTASQNRPMFVIDPATDPVLVNSMNTTSPTNLQNFLHQFGGCYTEQQTVPGVITQQICQQYRPNQTYTCNQTLNVATYNVTRFWYYPSQCISNSVWCTTWSWCGTPSQAMSQGWYWAFKNGSPLGQITSVSSCTVGCDYDTINGIGFNRGDSVAFCDLNNCGTIVVGASSEGIPTYTCTGGVGGSTSVPPSCPAGYDMTVATDGMVTCRQSIASTYQNNPSCSKISEVPQISLTPGLSVVWEIWACDSWTDACTTFEARVQ
ncbi:MAG: hypothetical protein ACYC9J_06390 [Sulfuricaulis sp.]